MTTSNLNAAQRLATLAASLGPIFADRAAAHDLEGRFVAENYALLKEHQLFSVAVPAELGGGGASYAELCEFLRELGQYCGSTALSLSMHSHLLAAAVWRHRHGQPAEALLRKVAAQQLVLVSTGAGDWLDSVGQAERVPGGYRISAVKRFCSGAPAGDLLVTSAPEQQDVIHFAVPLSAEGVRLRDDWDTLGMRGTGSHSIELSSVFVREDAITLRRPRGEWHPSWSMIMTVAPPLYMAPYLGVAERAAAVAREKVAQRALDAALVSSLGELENQLTLARLCWRDMIAITNDYDVAPTPETASRMLVRKTLVANATKSTVAKALEVVGGGGYFRRLGLERLLRDVEGAPFHPLPEKKQLEFTGRVALGLSPVP